MAIAETTFNLSQELATISDELVDAHLRMIDLLVRVAQANTAVWDAVEEEFEQLGLEASAPIKVIDNVRLGLHAAMGGAAFNAAYARLSLLFGGAPEPPAR